MANRYIARSKLSNEQVEALLWAVCSNFSVPIASENAGISVRSAAETMRKLRDMIARSDALFHQTGLPLDWPDDDDPLWQRLHTCVFDCPSEIRESFESLDGLGTALLGNRRLCSACEFLPLVQPRPMLLRTLRHLRTEQRGLPTGSFKSVFLTALVYDRFRDIELDRALEDDEAMKRLGSTRRNHMTMMFEACKQTLRKA